MRFRRLELEDQPWFPDLVKEGMTDYLRFLFQTFDLYHPAIPLLWEALQACNSGRVVDLCSGSGGAIEKISTTLLWKYNKRIEFVLTDIIPRINSWQHLSKHSPAIHFEHNPVDATNVPGHLKGFRTIFSGIHHFDPEGVEKVLVNATRAGEGIAIFDGGDKNIWMMLLIMLFHPGAIVLFTPFIAPFRWSRLFFTYLVPLIPAAAIWDGIISISNLYKPDHLLKIAQKSNGSLYEWKSGKVRNKFGMGITFLIGLPSKTRKKNAIG